jgi:single-strand DNA-binding protein
LPQGATATEITNSSTTKIKVMYALRNKVQLIGHVGQKPQCRNLEGDKKLVRFSVATNETYRNAQGVKITDTQWHNLVAFGKVAEIAEKYLDKGTEVAIEGKLVNRNYTDKEGVKKYVTEIQVSELLLLGSATKTIEA